MINCGYVCTCFLVDYELYHIHVEDLGLMRNNSFHLELSWVERCQKWTEMVEFVGGSKLCLSR